MVWMVNDLEKMLIKQMLKAVPNKQARLIECIIVSAETNPLTDEEILFYGTDFSTGPKTGNTNSEAPRRTLVGQSER